MAAAAHCIAATPGASQRCRRREAKVWDTEIGDQGFCGTSAYADRDEPVDCARIEPGIVYCAQRCFQLQFQRAGR